ncbi:MAG: radical SAM protein [Desulfuromonadales bacterium]|jgi:hypothetical protein
MSATAATRNAYRGFEMGPIRPPSEADSLLLRVTRNCPWNQCTFCSLYHGASFSIRPVDDLKQDIDGIRVWTDRIRDVMPLSKAERQRSLAMMQKGLETSERTLFHAAFLWLRGGMRSVFLQDANSLLAKPADLAAVLEHLRKVFPEVERVTSYARSHTVARIDDDDLGRLSQAGLNRIHIGMESGSDAVLALVKKGVDKQTHIAAGKKVKRAGIALSEYVMPGLGGQAHSSEHALETADAINRIDPDFIRVRTLAIPPDVALFRQVQSGHFVPLDDLQVASELLLFLDHLEGITSVVKSDHILNLFQEVEGTLPDDQVQMTQPLRRFLAMDADQKLLYMVGRRTGILTRLSDLQDGRLRAHAERARDAYAVTWENLDNWTAEMMQRFI